MPATSAALVFTTIESKKALVSLLTLTAPDSWGGWKGSMLYAGIDYGAGYACGTRWHS